MGKAHEQTIHRRRASGQQTQEKMTDLPGCRGSFLWQCDKSSQNVVTKQPLYYIKNSADQKFGPVTMGTTCLCSQCLGSQLERLKIWRVTQQLELISSQGIFTLSEGWCYCKLGLSARNLCRLLSGLGFLKIRWLGSKSECSKRTRHK